MALVGVILQVNASVYAEAQPLQLSLVHSPCLFDQNCSKPAFVDVSMYTEQCLLYSHQRGDIIIPILQIIKEGAQHHKVIG